ncbi:HIT domain-containing protein [Dehalococcoidia bacterium]|nr:HIT domain-containing protein [Dehalococcoidia bacterium]
MVDDCIFCKIRDGKIPSEKIYSNDYCFVIRDIAPRTPTHVLIIPNEHFTALSKLDKQHHEMLCALFESAEKVAKQEGLKDGHRLVFNQGDDAGQQVEHLHLHLLGGRRLSGMA